jgi:preprotein translocase subunit SecB
MFTKLHIFQVSRKASLVAWHFISSCLVAIWAPSIVAYTKMILVLEIELHRIVFPYLRAVTKLLFTVLRFQETFIINFFKVDFILGYVIDFESKKKKKKKKEKKKKERKKKLPLIS